MTRRPHVVRDIGGHSVRVPSVAELAEMEAACDLIRVGRLALQELVAALEARDLVAVITAERRLLAVGLCAGDSARRLEGRR